MSLEQLKVITEAENEAAQIKSDTAAQAKKIIFEAKKNGEELIENTVAQSNQEAFEILQTAEKSAISNADIIKVRALQDSENLKTRALEKKDSSIFFIVERIVKS